jgi:hypothetical protein
MRTLSKIIKILPAILFLLVIAHSCKDDSFSVPAASTQADFAYVAEMQEDTTAPLGLRFKVEFTNKSVNAISYFWDFGNGQTSTEENPVTYYYQSGQYTAKLTVTGSDNLHYNKLNRAVTMTFVLDAVPLPFLETFDNEENIPEIFTNIDADGDGLDWYWSARDGNGHLRSQSYDPDQGALTPDNYLVTPKIDLSTFVAGDQIMLNYKVCPSANTPMYRREHYGVFVSTTGKEPADFVHLMFEETLTTDMTNWVFALREVDLSAFVGEYIYVAIRHYNVTDMDRIALDDIAVFKKE